MGEMVVRNLKEVLMEGLLVDVDQAGDRIDGRGAAAKDDDP